MSYSDNGLFGLYIMSEPETSGKVCTVVVGVAKVGGVICVV